MNIEKVVDWLISCKKQHAKLRVAVGRKLYDIDEITYTIDQDTNEFSYVITTKEMEIDNEKTDNE